MSETAVMLDDAALVALADRIAERLPRPGALVDAEEAARLLGLFNKAGKPLASWVLAEARAERIPHTRMGHYVRFDPDLLRAWARERTSGPIPKEVADGS